MSPFAFASSPRGEKTEDECFLATRAASVAYRAGFDPADVAERRAIHEQILAINRRLENLKGSLSDLTVRLGAHSAAVTLPPTESA